MARKTLLSLSLVLALLGLADAGYLAHAALTGGQLTCSIEGLSGCNIVAQSVYSRLFGVPLAVYGVLFYGLVLLTLLLLYLRPWRMALRLLALLAGIGLLASLAFEYIQVALIKAVCLYCLASGIIAALLAVLAWLLIQRDREAVSAAFPP